MSRFLLASVLLTLIALTGLTALLDRVYTHWDESASKSVIEQQVDVLVPLLRPLLTQPAEFPMSEPDASGPRLERVAISRTGLPPPLVASLKNNGHLLLEKESGLQLYIGAKGAEELIVASLPVPPTETHSLQLAMTLIFYAGVILILLVWLVPLARRLMLLRRTARAIGSGDLDARVNVGSGFYLKEIEQEFNTMAEKNSALIDDVKLLSGGLSHELRTPLASVRMGLDMLLETGSEKERQHCARRVNHSLDRVENLLKAMLNYSRLEHALAEAPEETVDITEVITDCLAQSSGHHAVNVQSQGPCLVAGSKLFITHALDNVVRNAVQHAASAITITLCNDAQWVHIQIEDDGEGFGNSDPASIFKPFVRLNRKREGHGIGLALAARIVRWYKGKISAGKAKTLPGACVTIKLPAVR